MRYSEVEHRYITMARLLVGRWHSRVHDARLLRTAVYHENYLGWAVIRQQLGLIRLSRFFFNIHKCTFCFYTLELLPLLQKTSL